MEQLTLLFIVVLASCVNVLLKPMGFSQWEAKVSSYSSATLVLLQEVKIG